MLTVELPQLNRPSALDAMYNRVLISFDLPQQGNRFSPVSKPAGVHFTRDTVSAPHTFVYQISFVLQPHQTDDTQVAFSITHN